MVLIALPPGRSCGCSATRRPRRASRAGRRRSSRAGRRSPGPRTRSPRAGRRGRRPACRTGSSDSKNVTGRRERGLGVAPVGVVARQLGLRRDADRRARSGGRSRPARRRGGSCTRAGARRGTCAAACARSSGASTGTDERAPLAEVAHVDQPLEAHLLRRHVLGREPLARLLLELLELRLDRRPDRPSRPARGTSAVMSWRTSTSRQPSAEVMPGFGGTSTVGIDSSRARSAPCSAPAPPKTTSANSRGS